MNNAAFGCIFLLIGYHIKYLNAVYDPTQHPNWGLLDNERCGENSVVRIIGGDEAALGQYPWIARVGYTGPKFKGISYTCGGAILTEVIVVTAAHCIETDVFNLKAKVVAVGEHNSLTDPDCDDQGYCAKPVQVLDIEEVTVHEEFNNKTLSNDIALIKLQQPIQFNETVRTICLPEGHLIGNDLINVMVDVAGWGVTDIDPTKGRNVLQTTSLQVQSPTVCQRILPKIFNEKTQMCVGGKIGFDSCGGDSGGPLMLVGAIETPKTYLIGLVSYGERRCGKTEIPAVYTRTSAYLEWILNHLS